ncbi:hypothetical protein AVEN_254834-1 [Araneus ventricosus]|uniref:Uncharacterized protein n=1 Tax=Araneus ventricosus TaxID=182803 RepID=A0A4Y2IUR2_ARAVE|nr:hypothetical protein AVEN_254834-1 [Araneus ventricosus]
MKVPKRSTDPRLQTRPRPVPTRVVFAFLREARSPPRGWYFSFITECAKWKTNDVGFPNFSTTTSPIFNGYSHWQRVLGRGAPNGVERCARKC